MATRREKQLASLRSHINDASPDLVERVLRSFGFELDRQRGSHKLYRHPDTGAKFSFPYRRPVRAVYVKNLIELLEKE